MPPGAAHRSSTRSPGSRARARARRPSRRATAASAARRCHSRRREGVERARRGSAPPSSTTWAGQALGERRRGGLERVGAQRRLGRLVVGGHQRAGGLGAERRPTTARAIHSGCEWLERRLRGVAVRQRGRRSGAPRATARRRTALTRPAPRGASRLASSTDSPTAACAGTRSRKVSWKTPRRSAASTGASSFADDRRVRRLDHVVERGHALDGAVAELGGQREIARVQPQALGFAVQRAVGPRLLLEHAAHDGVRARARRSDYGVSASMDGPGFPRQPLRSPGLLIGSSMPQRARAGDMRRPHTEVQIPVCSSRLKTGCLQPFLLMLERSSKNGPIRINLSQEG